MVLSDLQGEDGSGAMKTKRRTYLILSLAAIYFALFFSPVNAQEIEDTGAADLDDFGIGFKNPASISFLPNQLIFGTSAHEIGINSNFFDISNGYLAYYSPYWRKRIGVFGDFLRTGIFNTTELGVSYSERLNRIFAVGGRIDFVNQGFNENRFQGVDPGDPVLSSGLSKNYVSVTAGLITVPVPELSLGAVVKNINKPDVAMEKDNAFRLPLHYAFGLQYRAGRLHPSVNVGVEDGDVHLRLLVGVEVWEDICARVDYQAEHMGVEGQMKLYRGLHFDYRYEYPLNELNSFSKGSHSFSLIYDFTRILDKPSLPPIEYSAEPVELKRTEGEISVEGDFYVLPSTNHLEIWEKNITRKVDTDVPVMFIKRNYKKIFEELGNNVYQQDVGTTVFYPDTVDRLVGTYTPDYRSSLDSISDYLWNSDSTETWIYARDNDVFRAENIKDVLMNKSQISDSMISLRKLDERSKEMGVEEEEGGPFDAFESREAEIDTSSGEEVDLSLLNETETFIVLSEPDVEFEILSLGTDYYNRQWSLIIRDGDETEVKTFTGVGNVPGRIEWNWRDEEGDLLRPGWYSFVFGWEDHAGKQKETSMGKIHVKKNKKNIMIELTRKKKLKDKKTQRIELHLDQ